MKRLIPVIAFVFMLSCSGGNDFRKFSDKLPVLEMPIQFSNSGLIRHQSPQDHDPALFTKFAPVGADKVLGKLYEDGKTVSIIYLYTGSNIDLPVLMTYSTKGIKLDSLNLFFYDPAYGDVSRLVTLLPDRKIQAIDSAKIWTEVPTDENQTVTEAVRMQQLSVDTVLHIIDGNGKIIEENN